MYWSRGSFSHSVGGRASGGPARSKVTVFFLTLLVKCSVPGTTGIFSRIVSLKPLLSRKGTRRGMPFRILPCAVSLLFSHEKKRVFWIWLVSAVTQKAANAFPRPLLDSVGDAVLEQGLVAVVMCASSFHRWPYFSPVSVSARPLGDAGEFIFVQCSGKQTTIYLFKTSCSCWCGKGLARG